MTRWRVLSLLIILLGAYLRFHALAQDVRFSPDEALFSTFARRAAINGDWWFPGSLDKPPLTLYANALSQVFVGDSEFAARLPGTLASIVLMAVMAALANAFYLPHPPAPTPQTGEGGQRRLQLKSPLYAWRGDISQGVRLPLFTLILITLSPFAIAYSATAYTDGLMLLCGALALLMALRRRWGWAGIWLGLGFASKQQALFYLPLLLALGWTTDDLTWRRFVRFVLCLSVILGLLWLWDTARPGTSLFTLALANNDPGRLIRSNELIPRLLTWFEYGQALLGPSWLTLLLVVLTIAGVIVRVRFESRQRQMVIDLVLLMFVIAYGLLHWLVAFNTYERYLLLILPPIILLAGRGLDVFSNGAERARQAITPTNSTIGADLCVGPVAKTIPRTLILPMILVIALFSSALTASERRSSINADHDSYTGIDELAAYLNAQPVATVIYDRWLGWELGYYLGQWHDKRMVYYPTPDLLVKDALRLCEIGPRYFPAPAAQAVGPWLDALREAGFEVDRTFSNEGFVVYRLLPPWTEVAACGL